MDILWWLAPPVIATGLAMIWVSWLGRSRRGQVDPEVAVRRLGDAMSRPTRTPPAGAAAPRAADREDRSTGVAVRPPRRESPAPQGADETRRAS